ncbi:MAG: hypothetical protein IJS92_03690 [Paludibacteraceae bacterium]|nr:hypothetical protein [Paludibacteraceae bacterium]
MKKLFIVLLSVVAMSAVAQQKKVAVYVTGQQTGINKVLGDQLVAAFAKSGKYIAIERTASFLAELGKEQNYQRTGAVDDNELSRLGKQFGVQLVCVADVSDVFGEKYISTRLIDVESAEVINTSNATSKLESMPELLKVTEGLAKELTAKTVQEKAAEALAVQKANEETEKMLNEAFTKGYMKVENIYVATSYVWAKWKQVSNLAAECRLGGMTGWRLPTASELRMIRSACTMYASDSYKSGENKKYPHVDREILRKIDSIVETQYGEREYSYWLSDGSRMSAQGSMWGNSSNTAKLLLVRDVK